MDLPNLYSWKLDTYLMGLSPHNSDRTKPSGSVRINISLRGEPAQWLLDWKRRGLVRSNHECCVTVVHVVL